jgi:hypothetical protein
MAPVVSEELEVQARFATEAPANMAVLRTIMGDPAARGWARVSRGFRHGANGVALGCPIRDIARLRAMGRTGRAIAAELSLPVGSVFQVIREFRLAA